MQPFATLAELFAVLRDERVGDVVTALEHHLQCAALLRLARPGDEELQIAGLVHDVASSLDPAPGGCHAAVGGLLVRRLFGARVGALVAGHVAAKRWLVTTDPGYRARLSENSVHTLSLQGEELDEREQAAFLGSPERDDIVLLRRADDAAKLPGAAVPPLDAWRVIAERVAAARGGPS
jgi:predicted HD phosphohydrolase